MGEGPATVEVAHHLSGHGGHGEHDGLHAALELVEVLILAIVAIATAWSGYQAVKWDAQQRLFYGESSAIRFEAEEAKLVGTQQLAADAALLNGWLQAVDDKDLELMRIFEKRFSPEYRVGFDAWLKTDPLTNPDAPAGPAAMPEYKNVLVEKGRDLHKEAEAHFHEGTEANHTAEKYVRDTVLFAMVLFLVAMAQRLKHRVARIALNAFAGLMLVYVLFSVVTLPRL
jgi:hypothetical protein